MSISFEELAGSPRIVIGQQGVTATRSFKVAWSDWQDFARLLLGTYRVIGAAPQFLPPIQFPGLPNLLVAEVQVEPVDAGNPDGSGGVTLGAHTNAYPAAGARVTATYRTAFEASNRPRDDLPQVPDGTVLTFNADLGAEYLHVPGRAWFWNVAATDGVAEDIHPGILIPSSVYTLTWSRVPLPPWTTMRTLRGKVNSTSFLGSPAGTVLFLGARAVREFQFIEEGGFWRLEYQFSENTKTLVDGATKVGWNYWYREQALAGEHWSQIYDENGHPPYSGGDFTGLFQFGTT